MKNLIWGLFAFATLAHAQGTVTDIDGNTYDYLTYGTQQWTVENAAMETYRDGTPIPQVTDATQWSNLTTGAWCYYDNDPTKGKLYNWYAVAGIHDNDPNTPNKEFAPLGWHVPTDAELTTLEEYLIANGYNYDGTTTGNKIAKAMASTTGWNSSTSEGAIGNNQSLNNSSGFNAFPEDFRANGGSFDLNLEGYFAAFWSSTENNADYAWYRFLSSGSSFLGRDDNFKQYGFSIRFVRESNTCSEASINASATEVCAGESVDLTVSSGLNYNCFGSITNTLNVPSQYNSIQSAINSASNGDVILIQPGTYYVNDLQFNSKVVHLISEGDYNNTFIDGGGNYRLLTINNPTGCKQVIKGITFRDGNALTNGGYVTNVVSGNTIFKNCLFEDNGGGTGNTLFRGSGQNSTSFYNCIFRNNSAENYAGVGNAFVKNCFFTSNNGWNNTSPIVNSDVLNSTIINNGGGAGNSWTTGGITSSTVMNSIIFNNGGNQECYNCISVNYSIIEGGYTGIGNISSNPQLSNQGIPSSSYPGLDLGNPDLNNDGLNYLSDIADQDPDGTRLDIGSYYFQQGPIVNQPDDEDLIYFSTNNYQWSTGDTTANILVTPTETTEYWVDVTTNGVTCREYITINVTAPAAPTGDAQQTFCASSTVADLTATGENIQWYDAATGGNLLDSTTALTDGQMVYATQTVNGCESTDRLEVTVSIQDITITASATEVCAGDSVDLSIQDHPQTIGTVQIFVDGVLVSSETDLNFNNLDHNAPMFFGVENPYISLPSGPQYLNGTLDDIAIWNRPLSPSDVMSLYNNPSVCSISDLSSNLINGLVGYWPFCGDANDIGEFNLNGVNNGGTLQTDRFGNSGRAYFLGSNNWIEVNHNNVLNVSQSSYTLSAWVKKETTGPSQFNHFITKTAVTTSPSYSTKGFCLRYENSTAAFFETQHPPGQNFIPNFSVNSSQVDMSQWHLITGVYYGSINNNENSIIWSTGDTSETISVTPTETTEYWVDITTNGVTCREYITINVTSPAAPTGPLTQTFCDTASLADLTAIGDNIQWYDAATGGNLLDSTTALTDGQMVYASQTVNGCESTDRLEVTVSIQDITLTASATEVCAGETITITAQSLGLLLDNKFCSKNEIPITLHDSLLGAWPFCGNPNDVSGNNFNGTINGGVSLGESRFGDLNDSYIFDGQPLTYISMGTHESLDITQGSISISCWVDVNNVGGTKTILSKANNDTTNLFGSYNLHINGDTNFVVTNSTNTNGFYSLTNGSPTYGGWLNIIAVADINDLKLRLYLDGLLVSEIDWEGTYKGGLQEFLIGSHYKSNFGLQYMYNFNGSIDDVAIWNRVLNQYEVDYLSMTNSSTYSWSTGDTTETISVTPTETTEYWVDVTTNGVTCREYVTINVTAPAAPTGDAEQTFCEASTVADLTATGDNIQWYDAATGGNLLDSTTALTNGQMVYASQTVNGCESTDRFEVSVLVQEINLDLGEDIVACQGETIILDAGSGYDSYLWSTGETTQTISVTEAGSYSVTINQFQNQNSGIINLDGSNDFIEVNHDVLNNQSSGTIQIRCKFDSPTNNKNIFFYGSENDSMRGLELRANDQGPFWSWHPGPGNVEYVYSNVTVDVFEWHTYTAQWTPNSMQLFVDGQLVGESNSISPNLSNLDSRIRMGRMGNSSSTYSNLSIDFLKIYNTNLYTSSFDQCDQSSQNSLILDYSFNTNDNSIVIDESSSGFSGELVNGPLWQEVLIPSCSSCEFSDTINIAFNDLPEAPTGETVNYFINCDSFSPTLNDVIATLTGDNIKLYDAAVGGNLLDPNSNILDGQVVYASQTLDSCESSDRLEVQLNLYTLDTPVTDAPNNTVSFCNEQNLTILDLAPAQTATDRLWYETATSTTPITETTPLVDGVTYYVSNYNLETGCESDRLAMTVEINNPEAPTGDTVQSFCDNVTVSDLSASGSNIQWYDAATGGNVLDPGSALSDGQVLYASQTQNGCESVTRLEVSVEIDIIPDPILITTELEFCLAKEATLVDLEVDEQGFALEWYDSFIGGNMLPMDTLLEDGVSYYATLYDAASGCESLMRLEVVPTVIPCEVVIYNAISLNDNGINDYMVIENAEYFPDNSLEIYNRDGHLLYSQTQYGIGDNLFRGVANVSGIYGSTLSGDGPRLPTGSYLYVFKYFNPYEQQEYTLKGFLTINSN